MNERGNYAFIDSQNLHVAIRELGWRLDFNAFRTYLREQHNVVKACIFIGYLEENAELYSELAGFGYELFYKKTIKSRDGTVKGNVDTDLVLQAMIELPNYDKAVIVTGDGDFASLAAHLLVTDKLACVLIPNRHRFSSLLKEAAEAHLVFLSDMREQLQQAAPEKKEDEKTVKPKTAAKPKAPKRVREPRRAKAKSQPVAKPAARVATPSPAGTAAPAKKKRTHRGRRGGRGRNKNKKTPTPVAGKAPAAAPSPVRPPAMGDRHRSGRSRGNRGGRNRGGRGGGKRRDSGPSEHMMSRVEDDPI